MNKARANVSVIDPIAGVSYVLPVAAVSYVLINYSAEQDVTGRYPYVQDVCVVADSSVLAFAKVLNDSVAAADALQDFVVGKAVSDTISLQDVCAPLLIILRSFTEASTVSDASLLEFGKNLAEEIDVSQDSNAISIGKVLADTPEILESLSTSFDGTLDDLVGIGDIVNFINGWYRVFDETVPTADAFDRVVSWNPTLVETPVITELLAADYSKPFSEDATISDSSIQSLEYLRTFADNNISLLGTPGSFNELALNVSSINDDFGVERIYLETGKGLSETQDTTDVFDRVLIWDRAFAESASTSDVTAADLGKPLSDSNGVTDSVDVLLEILRSYADSLSATDTASVSFSQATAGDSVATSDSFDYVKATSPPFLLNAKLLNETVLNAST